MHRKARTNQISHGKNPMKKSNEKIKSHHGFPLPLRPWLFFFFAGLQRPGSCGHSRVDSAEDLLRDDLAPRLDGSGDLWGGQMVMTEKPGGVGFFGCGVWAENWLISLNMILGLKRHGKEMPCVFILYGGLILDGFSLRKQPLNPSNGHGSKHIASHIFGDPLSNFPHRGAGKNRGFPQIPGIPKELHWNWNRQFREKGRVTSLGVSWLIWIQWLILPPLGWFEVSSRMEDGGPGGVVF